MAQTVVLLASILSFPLITAQCTRKYCDSNDITHNTCQDLSEKMYSGHQAIRQDITELKAEIQRTFSGNNAAKPCEECHCETYNNSSIPYNSAWRDCDDAYKAGYRNGRGIFWVKPPTMAQPIKVFCDNNPFSGGGWTVFQRRLDGKVNFNRSWVEYKDGFGFEDGEFWLGNEILTALTNYDSRRFRLKVEVRSFSDEWRYAMYEDFKIMPETDKYELIMGDHSGTLPDSGRGLSYHNNQFFSTYDSDNDKYSASCAQSYVGGFWFNNCLYVHLNGVYSDTEDISAHRGIIWTEWLGNSKALKQVEMKFRPVDYNV